jgi:hypothetical protein
LALPAYSAQIQFETDKNLDATARYGLAKLNEALRDAGQSPEITIIAGLSSGNVAVRALKSADTPLPEDPEGLARPSEALLVTARAEDPSGIKSLRLRYRHLTQMEDYLTADMARDSSTGLYSAQIPGEFITAAQDVMYFIEAIDNAGNGRNYPDLEISSPYVVVSVERPVAKAVP